MFRRVVARELSAAFRLICAEPPLTEEVAVAC